MTQAEMQAEALMRAESGQSMTNFPAIFAGFMAKGIPEAEILPRENVLTFNAWKAKGRSVKKGEHGVRVVTFVPVEDKESGEITGKRPWTSVVFHISQTESNEDRESRIASQGYKPRSYGRRYGSGRSQDSRPRDYVRDPGEDSADRWLETHGDR